MYQLQQIPGEGRGLIARRNMTRGQRILAESPLFTFPNIEDTMPIKQIIGPKVQALNGEQRRTFFGLFNNFRYFGTTGSIGIIKTNALRVDHETDAVFPTFSLTNHSCLSNASYSWDGNIKCDWSSDVCSSDLKEHCTQFAIYLLAMKSQLPMETTVAGQLVDSSVSAHSALRTTELD